MHVELIIYVCTKKLHSVIDIFNTCITLSGRIKADRTCVFSPTLLNYYDKFVKKPDYSAFFILVQWYRCCSAVVATSYNCKFHTTEKEGKRVMWMKKIESEGNSQQVL